MPWEKARLGWHDVAIVHPRRCSVSAVRGPEQDFKADKRVAKYKEVTEDIKKSFARLQ